jgi:hypothetical protein
MEFFFPDSQDQVDPRFDFVNEQWSPHRVRQRDDLYAHEVHYAPPYTGILVSKTIVDGLAGAGRYTGAQRHRLYRLGVRGFFRLDTIKGPRIATLGDCGAFSYVNEVAPPFSPDQVIDFYEHCGFDLGISVDHIIFQYRKQADVDGDADPSWLNRQAITLDLAERFFERAIARGCYFTPMGVAQGWSPRSYAAAVERLQEIGYTRIALGGMVPLKTEQILDCLRAIEEIREPETVFHLLGVTRTDYVETFAGYGVTSFDSTSPFRQAFKDADDNYYAPDRNYIAIRIPQVEGNQKFEAKIRAGQVDQRLARRLERRCLDALVAYDRDEETLTATLNALREYEKLWDGKHDRTELYRGVLEARPWKACPCAVCEQVGVQVILFRGTERNKRRGFHNLFVFNEKLQHNLTNLTNVRGKRRR